MRDKTLVLGASENTERYSNIAIKRLRNHNVNVIAVGLKDGQVGDVLISKALPLDTSDIDTITLYLGPKNQVDYLDFIINSGAKRVIFNPGTENASLFQNCSDKGMECLNACTLVMLSTGSY